MTDTIPATALRAAYFAGKAEHLLPGLPDDHFSSVITDPPYGLAPLKTKKVVRALEAWLGGDRMHVPDGKGFMSKDWDRFVPPPGIWDECYRVLKPGGWLLCFAAPRTADLMGLSIRLAGFEVTDSLHWINGEGFPKAKSRLKPAHEPILMAWKPARNSPPLAGLEGCAVGTDIMHESRMTQSPGGVLNCNGRDVEHGNWQQKPNDSPAERTGRWPPNLLLTHDARCNGECTPGCPVAAIDAQSGITRSSGGSGTKSGQTGISTYGTYAHDGRVGQNAGGLGDTGGASRFFPQLNWDPETDDLFRYQAKAPASERPVLPDGTKHPTCKPLALMRWIARLITPPDGRILDPFAGTGTTLQAALLEGFPSIGFDSWPPAVKLARVRLAGYEGVVFG